MTLPDVVIRPHTKGMVRGVLEPRSDYSLVVHDQSLSSAARSFVLLLAEILCGLDLLVILADIAPWAGSLNRPQCC